MLSLFLSPDNFSWLVEIFVVVMKTWLQCTRGKPVSAQSLRADAERCGSLSFPSVVFATRSIINPPLQQLQYSRFLNNRVTVLENAPYFSQYICSAYFKCYGDECAWSQNIHPLISKNTRIISTVNPYKFLRVLSPHYGSRSCHDHAICTLRSLVCVSEIIIALVTDVLDIHESAAVVASISILILKCCLIHYTVLITDITLNYCWEISSWSLLIWIENIMMLD